MKTRTLLTILIVFLAALPCSAGIKVMSYNVRLGVADDGKNSWDNRKPATPAMLDEVRPDVFGVQEAHDFQIEYICSSCPRYKSVGVGREDGVSKGEHMSVFYNSETIELLDWGTYWLSETPDVPSKGWDAACYRTATWTLLKEKSTGKKFYFVNTHLDHKGFVARREGLALLHRKISEMNAGNLPMVLTGDFNVLPDNEGLEDINRLMKSARFSAIEGDKFGSFNGWGKNGKSKGAPKLGKDNLDYLLPIDYIYYSGFDVCTEFRVINKSFANIPYISDHYPVTACLADKGSRLETATVESRILGATKRYNVYLPEGYDLDRTKKYPVLYLLHGAGGTCDTWTKSYNMKTITDWRISSGFSLPMIIVMPDASGDDANHRGPHMGYFNYDEWRYEDFFFEEFIPTVESRYRIESGRATRAIAGLSMGGGGTTIYAMEHPEVFSSACPLSGRIEGCPAEIEWRPGMKPYYEGIKAHNMVKYLREATPEQQESIKTVRWYIDCGDNDYLLEGSLHLYELMRSLEFPCAQFRVREGTHQQEYWRTALPEVLTFISIGFKER